ncbi:MAG: Ubiquinone/menaquinone biosynthesis C-methyltransferase UbiE [candidate division WS2 bacterium]|nr:Ubiquinone/menaquinone biosynthesis C-methyltransferase UbiE [Candidatus Lithacetigena glycinireducens]
MERFYRNQKNLFVKAYAFLQYKKLYKYESTVCEYFDRCFMITEKDAEMVKQMNSTIKTAVMPSGVDTSYFYPLDRDEEPYSIVSVASMDWLPNIEGILWFYEGIFPLVKEIIPEVKLYIVGKNPLDSIKRLKNEGVFVSGFVEDVREYISKCRVFIVPLKTGNGMRIKILNALAMGKPVVSTSIGCEGIEVQHGKHIYIADTKEEFAHGVIELLKREDMRRKLKEEGLRLVKEKYQWERIAEEMEKEYKAMMDGKTVRHEIERTFYNKQVEKATTSKFYEFGVLESIDNYCFNLLEKEGLIGKDIIDYGCGSGWASFRLAKQGANVFAFDISDETVKALSQKAKQEKLLGSINAKVAAAESLEYANESIDGIIGFGILHHLNLDLAIPEIYRVLKSRGKAVFREPLGKNPLINLFRFFTPKRRTPTEKPLNFSDINMFEKYGFREVKHTEFYLLGLLAFSVIGFKNYKLYHLIFNFLNKFDGLIFRNFPKLREYSWITVIEAIK